MYSWIVKKLRTHISASHSPDVLAISFVIGNYIAFSPYLGLHSIEVIIFSWLLNLNMPLTFFAAYGINNPWTVLPIYTADYMVGYWFVHSCLKLDTLKWNPVWLDQFIHHIEGQFNVTCPCIWSFLIGGNLLGIGTSIVLYPVMKYLFKSWINEDIGNK